MEGKGEKIVASSALCVPGGEWRTRAPTVRDAMGSLVSQLTANPDVTRMSLPAVFLYPYTVLELCAFRSLRHQAKLMETVEIEDGQERLLGVSRWFMSCMERMVRRRKEKSFSFSTAF